MSVDGQNRHQSPAEWMLSMNSQSVPDSFMRPGRPLHTAKTLPYLQLKPLTFQCHWKPVLLINFSFITDKREEKGEGEGGKQEVSGRHSYTHVGPS